MTHSQLIVGCRGKFIRPYKLDSEKKIQDMGVQYLINKIDIKDKYCVPQNSFIYRLTRIEASWVQLAIKKFAKVFSVDLTEEKIQDISEFKTFNEFFTRELKKSSSGEREEGVKRGLFYIKQHLPEDKN